jgi:hypothetical protein
VVIGVLVAAAGTSLASGGDPYPGVVTVFTGCLNTTGNGVGAVVGLQANASTPAKPCGQNQMIVHFAGGTLTGITAGAGLTGGGTNGMPTLGLDSNYQLPQACPAGNVPGSNGSGSGYSCYTAGTGLQSDTASKTLSLAGSYQLPQGCSDGNTPGAASGGTTWDCYSAGTGLTTDTASKTLHLAGPYQLPQGCPAGQVPGSTGPGNNYACYAPGTGLSSNTSTNTVGVNVGTGLSTDSSNNVGVAGSYQLPQGCAAGQIAKWDGSAWQCAADNPTGLNGLYDVYQTIDVASFGTPSQTSTTVLCNSGDVATGGGVSEAGVDGYVRQSRPVGVSNQGEAVHAWFGEFRILSFLGGPDHLVTFWVVCAKTG